MAVTPSILRQFPFLRSLDDAELERLGERVVERDFPAQAMIFPDGVIGDRFYLLISGHVEIVKPTSEGEVVLNEMQPGDSFGEMSLLDGQPRSASARAAGAASVLEMPKEIFLSLIQRYPALLYMTALENAQRLRRRDLELISELQARNLELQQLYETSLDISRHLDLDRVLAAITERAQGLLVSSRSVLHLYDRARQLLIAASPRKTVRPGEGATGQAFDSGQAVVANYQEGAARRSGARRARESVLAAPISLDKGKVGTLTVFRPSDQTPFTQENAQLLLLLANQAAIAIENARLYGLAADKGRLDGEMHAARDVQRSLIPTRAPRIPGFQVTGMWRPAREVAGDFYDYIPLGRGRWGIAIADVSDKGAPAALFMAISRSVLRASLEAQEELTRVIGQANRVLAADATRGMFVTLFFGILEPRARRLTYVNAGHNPPLLLRAKSGRLERLTQHGLALGVDAEQDWVAHTLDLYEGDLLVLYTDGITEAFNPQEELFGEARLSSVVKAGSRNSASQIVRAIDREVREFAGARPLADDVTIVVLKARRASAGSD